MKKILAVLMALTLLTLPMLALGESDPSTSSLLDALGLSGELPGGYTVQDVMTSTGVEGSDGGGVRIAKGPDATSYISLWIALMDEEMFDTGLADRLDDELDSTVERREEQGFKIVRVLRAGGVGISEFMLQVDLGIIMAFHIESRADALTAEEIAEYESILDYVKEIADYQAILDALEETTAE